jgi:hypothetical protein
MKKLTLILIVVLISTLACTTVQFADTQQDQPTANPQDALETVLADAAAATEKAAAQSPDQATSTPEPESEQDDTAATKTGEAEPVSTFTPTAEVTATSSGYPTAIPLPNPTTSNFTTCLSDCLADGSNHQTSFPVKTEIIYFRFEFDEFPFSAPYTRIWYRDGVEWVRYNCYWPGPENGVEEITLTDPLGLPSGTWNVVITINGVQVVDETLEIEGSWNQWSPPGYFNSCYGKR